MVLNLRKKFYIATLCCFLSAGVCYASENAAIEGITQITTSKTCTDITIDYIKQTENLFYNNLAKDSYQDAIKYIDELLNATTKFYGPQSEQAANIFLARGIFYSDIGLYDIAKQSIDEANKISNILKDNIDLKNNVSNALFLYYFSINQPYETLEVLNTINPDTLKTNEDVLNLYERLGSTNMVMKNYKKAQELFDTYLAESNKILGTDNANILQYYQDLIYLTQSKSDYKAFETYYPLAVEQYEKNFEGNINQLSRNINAELTYHIEMLNYLAAKNILDKYIAEFKGKDLVSLYEKYADLNKDTNNFDLMYEYLDKIESAQINLPKNSLKHLNLIEKKIDYYKDTKEYEKAEEQVDKALALLEPMKDYTPYFYGKYLTKAGEIQAEKGQIQKSYEYFEKALTSYKKSFPNSAYPFYEVYKAYSESYEKEQKYEDALKYNNKALEINMELQGKCHKDIADLYSKQGHIYSNLKNRVKAISSINKSIKIYKKIYGKNHIKTYEKLMDKYYIYCNLGLNKQADKLLYKILNDSENNIIEGTKKGFYISLYRSLSYNYMGKGQLEQTTKYAMKALKNTTYEKQKQEIQNLLNEINEVFNHQN